MCSLQHGTVLYLSPLKVVEGDMPASFWRFFDNVMPVGKEGFWEKALLTFLSYLLLGAFPKFPRGGVFTVQQLAGFCTEPS